MLRANLSLLPNPNGKTIAMAFLLSILCVLSYLLGIYQNSRPSLPRPTTCLHRNPNLTAHDSTILAPALDFEFHHSASSALPPLPDAAATLPPIGFCDHNFTEYCPCQDLTRERRFPTDTLLHRERHCPGADERVPWRVPRPDGYRTPVKWPESRDRVWFVNVPYKRLTEAKADQHWVRAEGDQLVFPGGGTSFPMGVKGYVSAMAKMVPLRSGEIRTVLDIGCGEFIAIYIKVDPPLHANCLRPRIMPPIDLGLTQDQGPFQKLLSKVPKKVASFGGHLLNYNIFTMSLAPRDVHEAQVQFALERGLPAMLGVLSTYRLPYPSRSFDMVHCARCLVQWAGYEGLYLLEIDRVLKPGGYWLLSGPPINWKHMYKGWRRQPQDFEAEQTAIEDLTRRLCWKKIAEKGPIAAWRKPGNHVHCVKKSKVLKSPPFCEATDPDAAWYKKMEVCITPLPRVEGVEEIAGGALELWPKRLSVIPPRITSGSIDGITSETFNNDNKLWNRRLAHYGYYFNLLHAGKYRNIMDMNAGLGGFAAAMYKYPVWVMNAVPANVKNNTLGIIYERGLIGTHMDWCEAFSTYPRTYDLIHADGIFSIYMDKCGIIDILLEMDRILRPEGAVIIRDHVDVVVKAKRAADRLNWQSRIVHSELGPFHPEKLLIVDNSIAVNVNQVKKGK